MLLDTTGHGAEVFGADPAEDEDSAAKLLERKCSLREELETSRLDEKSDT